MPLASGTRLGPYEVLNALGAGGMGEVYRARDTRLNRDVALKLLPTEFARDPGRVHRFKQEAQAIAALNHPHICQIFDVGPDYLVLEYVEGQPLRGPLPPAAAARLALQIADALDAAHQRGILHRDLKPANIMVAPGDHAKLLDFGLAKLMDSDVDVTRTMAGAVVGTAAYMSPEQAEGRSVDARSDVFSLGAVLYELISGARAFAGTTMVQTLSAVLRDEPAPLRTEPALERLIMQCLAKDPGRRFQTMADVKSALERLSAKAIEMQPSIAVLPFTNLSADKENEYFSDGLAEEIINILAHMPGLTVIARTSAFAFKGKQEDIRRIAEALGVAHVLEGSVRRAGNRLRVSAQLIAASNGSHLWSERYDREMTDVFAIQDDIAQAIAAALQVRLLREPTAHRAHTPNLAAYEAYLKGRYYWAKLTPDMLARSRECYEQAIALDPDFALPHSFLGEHYYAIAINGVQPATEVMPKARAEAERAIELDPSLPEAHAMSGSVAALYDYDWNEAARQFRLATANEPVSPHVRLHYGFYLLSIGRLREARREYEHALGEDPLNALSRVHLAWCLLAIGEGGEAAAQLRRILEVDESFWPARWASAVIDALEGNVANALASAERAHALAPWHRITVALLAALLVRSGDVSRAHPLLAQLRPADNYRGSAAWSLFHFMCQEMDVAADWFEKAIEEHDAMLVLFMALRSSLVQIPRWAALAKKLNLPEAQQ